MSVLQTVDLKKHFNLGQGRALKAVDGVSLRVEQAKTLALVGESGSGKTTIGRLITRLLDPTSGQINFLDRDISGLKRHQLRAVYERMQMVFQNPMTSLSPRLTIRKTLIEPLTLYGHGNLEERNARVEMLMERVGLRPQLLDQLPAQLSGGQRQRVGIARALALHPALIVADEPTASLDVSTQAQVINLLLELQRDLALSYVFITHDLGIARHISHDTAVLYLGRVVETGPTETLFAAPAHPYTTSLVSTRRRGQRIVLEGQVPSQIDRPAGCHFAGRCPVASSQCHSLYPEPVDLGAGHMVRCHNPYALKLPAREAAPA